MGKQRTDLPLEKKIYVIRQSESGISSRKIAEELGVGKSQIGNIVRRKAEYLSMYDTNSGVMRRKFRKTENEAVNRVVFEWFTLARDKNLPITGPILQVKARSFARQLGNTTFTASNGWLASFRKRHQVASPNAAAQSTTAAASARSAVTLASANNSLDVYPILLSPAIHDLNMAQTRESLEFTRCISNALTNSTTTNPVFPTHKTNIPDPSTQQVELTLNKLPGIYKEYKPEDVWTMGETGLFFKAVPGSSASGLKSEKCLGGSLAEERLTLLLCCNVMGEKEKPVVIGSSYWPRCFENLDPSHLPVTWCSNRHAWMTSQIFEKWVQELDEKMRQQERKIILCLSSTVCHLRVPLGNIKLHFFPPDAPANVQPLQQGVFGAFKAGYRKIVLRHLTTLSCEISILEAAYWVGKAWQELTPEAIQPCFLACGFQDIRSAVTANDPTWSATGELPDREAERMMNNLAEGQDWRMFVSLDDELATHNTVQGNWESDKEGCEGDESTSTGIGKDVGLRKVMHCLDQCREYALQKGDAYFMSHITDLRVHLCKTTCEIRTRQEILSEFLANKECGDEFGETTAEGADAPPSCIPPIIPLASPVLKSTGHIPSHTLSVSST